MEIKIRNSAKAAKMFYHTGYRRIKILLCIKIGVPQTAHFKSFNFRGRLVTTTVPAHNPKPESSKNDCSRWNQLPEGCTHKNAFLKRGSGFYFLATEIACGECAIHKTDLEKGFSHEITSLKPAF